MVRISEKDFIRAFGKEIFYKLKNKDGISKLFLNKEIKDNSICWFIYGEMPDKTKKVIKRVRSHIVLSKLLGDDNFEKEYSILEKENLND